MATVKVSVAMQKRILELHLRGLTARKISKTLKVGRGTVKCIIERGDVVVSSAAIPEWAKSIDLMKVRIEVSQGVQLNILAREPIRASD